MRPIRLYYDYDKKSAVVKIKGKFYNISRISHISEPSNKSYFKTKKNDIYTSLPCLVPIVGDFQNFLATFANKHQTFDSLITDIRIDKKDFYVSYTTGESGYQMFQLTGVAPKYILTGLCNSLVKLYDLISNPTKNI